MKKPMIIITTISAISLMYAGGNHNHSHGHEASSVKNSGVIQDESKLHAGHNNHTHQTSPAGKPANTKAANKIIYVDLVDAMRFEFESEPALEVGDIVRFVVTNKGQIPHEFSVGTDEEHEAHRKMMLEMPNMIHKDGNTITVRPGKTKELTWQFSGYSPVMFACNIPGHFEAGMYHKATIQEK